MKMMVLLALCVVTVGLCTATTSYNNNIMGNNGFEAEDLLENPLYSMLLLKKAATNLGNIGRFFKGGRTTNILGNNGNFFNGGQRTTNGLFDNQRTVNTYSGGQNGILGPQRFELLLKSVQKNGNGLSGGQNNGYLWNMRQNAGNNHSGRQDFQKVLSVVQGTGNGLSGGQGTSRLMTAYKRFSALKALGFF